MTVLKRLLTKAFFITLLMILLFAVLTNMLFGDKLNVFDSMVIHYVQGLESQGLTSVMKFFTNAGSPLSVVILSCLILLFLYKGLHHRAETVLYLVVMAGAGVLNQVLKFIFHRPRPEIHRLVQATGYSFPSGHSMSAFAMYGVLAFLIWRHTPTRWGRFLVLLIGTMITIAIGTSRIYLGVHYPSDVVGGFIAGGFWLAACIWVYQMVAESKYEKSRLQN